VKAILGGTLLDGINPPQEFQVIIIRDNTISAIGPAATTPVPPEAEKIKANGKYVTGLFLGDQMKVGGPANVSILPTNPMLDTLSYDKADRLLRDGRWMSTGH